ncbi:ribonuclease H-like domain-containing protein [Tanacetum coccineum]
MSQNTKPRPSFYNNDFYYLVYLSTEEKYTTSLTKHYAVRYYNKEDSRSGFFKAKMSSRSKGKIYSDLRIKSVVHMVVKKKWGYGFLTSIIVRKFDDQEYEFSYAGLPILSLNDVEDMYLLQENLIDMVIKNKMGKSNKRLKGRDWTDDDVMKSNKMVKKIDLTLKHREQIRRLEEYVGGRPMTVNQLLLNQERVKSILLLAIPDEYLLKFHNVPDAKSLWEAIKSRFGGNEESKKMQKNVLKHQFENFSTASNESLDKAYDRFQKLISQLEVHGAPISKEDINQKFLRSLPSSWNQIALIMRNKPGIDEIDIDDLYNNLRVYEDEMKRSSSSTSNSQNLAFLSSENTNSTNEVSTASGDIGVSTAGGTSQVPSTPCAHDIDGDDLEELDLRWEMAMLTQMDGDDLEELDLRWQVAMLTVRVKKKGHFARECRSGRNQGRRSYGDNGRSNAPTNESSSQALVAQDGLGGYDWSNDFDVEPVNYALLEISSSSSSSSSDSKTNEANTQKPKTVYESVNRDKVIIEDWNSDDEDDVSEVQTVSPVKTNESQTVKHRVDKIGQTFQKQGIGFKKIKACFVCKSTNHLIKDCNFHDKKSQEPKLKNVVNTGPRVNKPVWDNAKRLKLLDESQVVLRAPRKDDVYSLDLKNIVPSRGITCLSANATADESKLWHRRLGHVNFKNINKLVKGYLVRGLALKVFVNDHTCVTCKKGSNIKGLLGSNITALLGSSGKDKGPTQEYILLPQQPHRTRIPVKHIAPTAHEKSSKSSPKDNDVQDSEDAADKEEQHQMKESEQDLQDELEKMDRPYVSTASTPLGTNAGESSFVYLGGIIPIDASTLPNADLPIDPNMPNLGKMLLILSQMWKYQWRL